MVFHVCPHMLCKNEFGKMACSFPAIAKKFGETFSLVSLSEKKFSFSFEQFRLHQQSREDGEVLSWQGCGAEGL